MSIIYVHETNIPNASEIKIVTKRNDCGLPVTSDNIILMLTEDLPVPCFVKVRSIDIVNIMESVYIADKYTVITSTASDDFLENIILESNMTLFPYAISEDFSETDHDSVTVVNHDGNKFVAMELQENIYVMNISLSMNLNHNTKELLMNYDRELGTIVKNMLTMGPTEFMMMQPAGNKLGNTYLTVNRHYIGKTFTAHEFTEQDGLSYGISYYIYKDGEPCEMWLYDSGCINSRGEDNSIGYIKDAVLMILEEYGPTKSQEV